MSGSPPCQICRSRHTAHSFQASDCFTGQEFGVYTCPDCGFAFTWPPPANLDKFYPSHYRRYGGLTAWLFKTLDGGRAAAVARRITTKGRALEIGCGPGWMLHAIRQQGWTVVGNERTVDSTTVAARQRGLAMFVGGLDSVKSGPQFDLVIIHQVLEHLLDPLDTLRSLARVLRPGGKVLLSVPNFASWQARLTGRHWQHLDLPRHLSHFTPKTIQAACEQAGLQIESFRFVSVERDPYGWLQSLLNQIGFTQNLLWLWLTGEQRRRIWTIEGFLMILACLVLAGPSYLLAIVSWLAGRGAIMEVVARRPAR